MYSSEKISLHVGVKINAISFTWTDFPLVEGVPIWKIIKNAESLVET